MTGLLVSVRDAAEALEALEGGATLIDVKEPSRGALGRADDQVIRDVIEAVGGRVPVSAALGELAEAVPQTIPVGLTFAKWGLACAVSFDWETRMHAISTAFPGAVLCAYADWRECESISTEMLCDYAIRNRFAAFLIDTYHKVGRGLLDHVDLEALVRIAERCRGAGVKLALAGSLNTAAIKMLHPVRPDWFAVRGAACEGGRAGRVAAALVCGLSKTISTAQP